MDISKLPTYCIDINEFSEDDGVTIMSLVEYPAVEIDFLKFSRKAPEKYSFDEEKRIVTGVALRADYPIYRKSDKGEFYVTFTPDTIHKIVQKFMREEKTKKVNIQHSLDVKGVYLFESFILNENHRLTYPEFKDISNGSWIVSYKVDNDKVWNNIKAGRINGFSVEINADLKDTYSSQKLKEIINLITILEN